MSEEEEGGGEDAAGPAPATIVIQALPLPVDKPLPQVPWSVPHSDFFYSQWGKSVSTSSRTSTDVKRPPLLLESTALHSEKSSASAASNSAPSPLPSPPPDDDGFAEDDREREREKKRPSKDRLREAQRSAGSFNTRFSCGSERSENSMADSADQVDVNRLLENDVGQALRMETEKESKGHQFQAFLVDLGFEIIDEARLKSFNRESFIPADSKNSQFSRVSLMSSPPADFGPRLSEKEAETFFVREIFGPPTAQSRVLQKHLSLTSTVKSAFSLNKGSTLEVSDSSVSLESHAHAMSLHYKTYFQTPARRIRRSSIFTTVFMVLTVYALFGMDLFDVVGNSDQEFAFVVWNTVVFFCFAFELLVYALAVPKYLVSIEFGLDTMALASVFTETWFVSADLLQDEAAGVMRMGRSSRVARLARLARIARFTRMMLKGLTCSGGRKYAVARVSLMRRLWRVFLFLDPDRIGHITTFDMKCLYMVMLKNHPVFKTAKSRITALAADVRWFSARFSQKVFLSWDEFITDFLSTKVGRALLQEQAAEVDGDTSAWTLTRKVSDSSALRISVVVLVLLGTITFFDPNGSANVREAAPFHLASLEFVARHEGADDTFLCDSITEFRQIYDIMYLYQDGLVRWEDGHCVRGKVTTDSPFREIRRLIAASKFRKEDYYVVCVPDVQDCSAVESSLTSVVLVNNSATNRANALRVILSTLVVIILLVIFISIMSAKMGNLAKIMLSPLHNLLDDMNVLSNLELAHVDEDMPLVSLEQDSGRRAQEDVHLSELAGLQENSKSLRNAIRSWSKYVPPSVVQRLCAAGLEAEIGVTKITATILFCDIVDFEQSCVGLEPEEVLQVLSTALGVVSDVVDRNSGTLLEFIGDEVLAVFNAPNKMKRHVYAGVISALEIHAAASELPELEFKGGRSMRVRCRCGVHTGSILAGNIGSHRRMKYGLLGDSINLTARLKTLNSRYSTQTLVSEGIVSEEYTQARVAARPVDVVAVKGKKKPTVVYEAWGKDNEEVHQAILKHCEAFRMYRERNFGEAALLFADVVRVLGEADGPSKMLLGRCERYSLEPPPPEWDGVERLNAKSFH